MSGDPGAYQTYLKFRTRIDDKQNRAAHGRCSGLYHACD